MTRAVVGVPTFIDDPRWRLISPWPRVISDPIFERVALFAVALLVFAPYLVINQLAADWSAHDLAGPVDRWVPFQPIWELVYVSIYLYVLIPVVYLRDAQLFRRALYAFCVMQGVCYVFFITLPVGLERPPVTNIHEDFLAWGVALNYVLDQPRNLFPSLHLANAFMVSLLLYRADRAVGLPALAWAALIGYSTLAAKHHLFADVVAGIALAIAVDRWLFRPAVPAQLDRSHFYSRGNIAAIVAAYPAILLLFYLVWRQGWQPFQWPTT